MKQFGHPPANRIRSQQDFAAVYNARQRAGDQNLLLFAIRNQLDHSRLGVSVSRKNGNAIRRARKKRLLREAFRLVRHQMPSNLDIIAIPRPTEEGDLQAYQKSLLRLARKLDQRLPAPERL
ncbi:Ribonuclease P protein component [Gimesia panareensis]|uniref:Ribonuclease P protein component n=1 Tax=Gimesia panareensis TaxID=2527978 RepID=A0A517QA84_9PLAN|nr:ribonuclease P protein component [Gimesia panareensis]QDT28511.1 Ribonuclease P protein component [Gimesia panareensis]